MEKTFLNLTVKLNIDFERDLPGRIYYEPPKDYSPVRITDKSVWADDENVLAQWVKRHKDEVVEKVIEDIRSGKIGLYVDVSDSDAWDMDEDEVEELYKVDESLGELNYKDFRLN